MNINEENQTYKFLYVGLFISNLRDCNTNKLILEKKHGIQRLTVELFFEI